MKKFKTMLIVGLLSQSLACGREKPAPSPAEVNFAPPVLAAAGLLTCASMHGISRYAVCEGLKTGDMGKVVFGGAAGAGALGITFAGFLGLGVESMYIGCAPYFIAVETGLAFKRFALDRKDISDACDMNP